MQQRKEAQMHGLWEFAKLVRLLEDSQQLILDLCKEGAIKLIGQAIMPRSPPTFDTS
jgi:hypothetical protein